MYGQVATSGSKLRQSQGPQLAERPVPVVLSADLRFRKVKFGPRLCEDSHLLALHPGVDCGAIMEEHSSVHQPYESAVRFRTVARLPASYARIDTTPALTVRYTTRPSGRWYLLSSSLVLPLPTNWAERCTESISPSHDQSTTGEQMVW